MLRLPEDTIEADPDAPMSNAVRFEVVETDEDETLYGRCPRCRTVLHAQHGYDEQDRLVEYGQACDCERGEPMRPPVDYEIAPKTFDGLLESVKGQVRRQAELGPLPHEEMVMPTPQAFLELLERVKKLGDA
jgi:uncharacterized C2H2 Zn-finger protein